MEPTVTITIPQSALKFIIEGLQIYQQAKINPIIELISIQALEQLQPSQVDQAEEDSTTD